MSTISSFRFLGSVPFRSTHVSYEGGQHAPPQCAIERLPVVRGTARCKNRSRYVAEAAISFFKRWLGYVVMLNKICSRESDECLNLYHIGSPSDMIAGSDVLNSVPASIFNAISLVRNSGASKWELSKLLADATHFKN